MKNINDEILQLRKNNFFNKFVIDNEFIKLYKDKQYHE